MTQAVVPVEEYLGERVAPSEMVVADQLRAYNDRDLGHFLSFWAADSKIYQWPDSLVADGLEEIRQAHAQRFAQPHLHAVLLSRMAVDELVIDRELVTRTEHDRPKVVQVIAIYEVRDGQIRRAWFKQADA